MSQATAEIRVRVARLQWPYLLSALNLRASEKLNKPAGSDKQVAQFRNLTATDSRADAYAHPAKSGDWACKCCESECVVAQPRDGVAQAGRYNRITSGFFGGHRVECNGPVVRPLLNCHSSLLVTLTVEHFANAILA